MGNRVQVGDLNGIPQIKPTANPVSTYITPYKDSVAPPSPNTGLEELAAALGVAGKAINAVGELKLEHDAKVGKDLRDLNKQNLEEYYKAHPMDRMLSPYITEGYNRESINISTKQDLAKFKSDMVNSDNLTPEEFLAKTDEFKQNVNKKLVEQGHSSADINEVALPLMLTDLNSQFEEHTVKYGVYNYGRLINTSADSTTINATAFTSSPTAKETPEESSARNQTLTKVFTDATTKNMQEHQLTPISALQSNLIALQNVMRHGLLDKNFDVEEVTDAFIKQTVGDKTLQEIAPDVIEKAKQLKDNFYDQKISKITHMNQLRDLQDKEVVDSIVGDTSKALTALKNGDVKGYGDIMAEATKRAISGNVEKHLGNIFAATTEVYKYKDAIATETAQPLYNSLESKILQNDPSVQFTTISRLTPIIGFKGARELMELQIAVSQRAENKSEREFNRAVTQENQANNRQDRANTKTMMLSKTLFIQKINAKASEMAKNGEMKEDIDFYKANQANAFGSTLDVMVTGQNKGLDDTHKLLQGWDYEAYKPEHQTKATHNSTPVTKNGKHIIGGNLPPIKIEKQKFPVPKGIGTLPAVPKGLVY